MNKTIAHTGVRCQRRHVRLGPFDQVFGGCLNNLDVFAPVCKHMKKVSKQQCWKTTMRLAGGSSTTAAFVSNGWSSWFLVCSFFSCDAFVRKFGRRRRHRDHFAHTHTHTFVSNRAHLYRGWSGKGKDGARRTLRRSRASGGRQTGTARTKK